MANGNELLEAVEFLGREKDISSDILFDAIEKALCSAYENHYSKGGRNRVENSPYDYNNVRVELNRQTGEYHVYSVKEVVEEVFDPVIEISLEDARLIDSEAQLEGTVDVEVQSREFSRIAANMAKSSILQTIREAEKDAIYNEFQGKVGEIITGIAQRPVRNGWNINLGKTDALLMERDMVPGERLRNNERIKVYVLSVEKGTKGLRIHVSRSDSGLVKKLFEAEVTEVQDGTVEIRAISREVGVRSKIAVWSNDPDVDPVGACVGVNGSRVNMVVDELKGEKVDIVGWDENPAILIENALSPAKVVSVIADADERSAKVVVPDNQLSLAIGKEGLNARLAARLTGFKIDIKSETQAKDAPGFRIEDYYDENGELIDDVYDEEEYYEEDGEYTEYSGEGEYAEDGEYTEYSGEGEYAEDGEYVQDGEYTEEGSWSEGDAVTEEGTFEEAQIPEEEAQIPEEEAAVPEEEADEA